MYTGSMNSHNIHATSRRRAAIAFGTLLLTIGTATVIPSGVAAENAPVSVVVSGTGSVTAGTDRPSGRVTTNFAITDTSLTATGAKICRGYSKEKNLGCRYLRLDGVDLSNTTDDDYWDDDEDDYWADYDPTDPYQRWDITGTPGSWNIAYPIGFEDITREECLHAAWDKSSKFEATIEVMNNAGTVLATAVSPFSVTCTGIEGGSAGPQKTQVYANKSAKSKSFTFFVVDTQHKLSSYRICRYLSATDSYFACDREDLKSRSKTDEGWTLGYNLTWSALGSSSCNYVDRKWPRSGFRVQFYDRDQDQVMTLYRTTQLRC
jgi:hypothetical protein